MWDVDTGQPLSQYMEHQKRAWTVHFSPMVRCWYADWSVPNIWLSNLKCPCGMTGLVNRIQEQMQQTNNVPLNLKVNKPVRVKLGKLKLLKVKLRVSCSGYSSTMFTKKKP